MDPQELLAFKAQRGQATLHKGRQEIAGLGEAPATGLPKWVLPVALLAALVLAVKVSKR